MLDYEGIQSFHDLSLSEQAAVDVSGSGSGAIQIVGRQLTMKDGSVVLSENVGSQPSGNIRIQTSESVELIGMSLDAKSSVISPNFGTGSGGDIAISTQQLVLRDGAEIAARTAGSGQGGDLDLNASESVRLIGISPVDPSFSSAIASAALGAGDAGNTTISTARLSIRDGSFIAVGTFGAGNGGSLTVNATESVEVIGANQQFTSILIGTTFGVGDAADITIDTSRLVLREGGQVASETFGGGAASITINATESVEASGSFLADVPAGVTSSAQLPLTPEGFGLSGAVSDAAGDVTINTPVLRLTDGAQVTVDNQGTGNAGSLQVNAESIFLNDGGGITAATASGEGGNIALQVQDLLQLRRASQITAEAGGSGNGGNVTLSADTIALLEGSSIDANAFEGQGGNIEIATQGLFLSPDSRITASSRLGVDGIVTITQPEIDTSSALVSLSDDPIDPTTQIVSACSVALENTFVVTGNGGLPPDPTEVLRGQDVWVDMRLTEIRELTRPIEQLSNELEEREDSSIEPQSIVEATGWQRQQDGTVELVAVPQGRVGNRWLDRPVCRE